MKAAAFQQQTGGAIGVMEDAVDGGSTSLA